MDVTSLLGALREKSGMTACCVVIQRNLIFFFFFSEFLYKVGHFVCLSARPGENVTELEMSTDEM